jgi:ABC-2 type transport system ATP-binding protein
LTDPLRVNEVSITRGDRRTVDHASFSVRRGEVVALLGPNGAGKTTLVDGILGLCPLDGGEISVYGETPHKARQRRALAACLQDGGLPHDLTVTDAVHYYSAVAGARINSGGLLARFGLTEVADRKVAVLSGGERRRLQVALAMETTDRLLILDEPTAALDVDARAGICAALVEHVTTEEGAVLFTTHLVEEAERYADRVVFLRAGAITHDETTAELRGRLVGMDVVRARTTNRLSAEELPDLPGARVTRLRAGLLECQTRDRHAVTAALEADSRFTAIQSAPATFEDVLFGQISNEGAQ